MPANMMQMKKFFFEKSINKLHKLNPLLKHSRPGLGIILISFIFILLSSFLVNQDPPDADTGHLMEIVSYMASPGLEGRQAGSPGLVKAAEFAVSLFEKFGLMPAGDRGFYQDFQLEYNLILSGSIMKLIDSNGLETEPELGKEYSFRGFTGAGKTRAEVIFAGYGISHPDIGYDDYFNIDAQDKIVMVFKANPSWKIDNENWGEGSIRSKAATARKNGAKAIIFLPTSSGWHSRMPIGSVMDGEGVHLIDFPQLEIGKELADKLLEELGFTLAEMQEKIDSEKKPASIKIGRQVFIDVKTEYMANQPTVNVVAMLPGSHPDLKDEYIVIGAHMDHVGIQAGKVYYPGANDNASGTAAVIELARMFSTLETKPARSVLFVLFDAEECGLKGATHFVENSPVAHDKIVAMLNFDCIAHGDSIQIGSGLSNPDLFEIAKNTDRSGLLVGNTWKGGGADATPFYNAGIPTLYFVTRDSYTYLHLPGDTPETLNPRLFTSVVQLGFDIALKVANGDYTREKVF
jgi:hypothetical protein